MMETYVKIPDWMMSRKQLSPAAKLLYGLLMSLCQSRGYCWATNGALADRMGMSTRSMTRLLGELREHGLVYDDRSNPETMELRGRRLLRLTELEEIAPDESGDISGEGDVDSSRDFGGWLNQCIARMEQAKRQWAQTHPQQPEYGDSADLGQELQVAATPKTAGDAGFGAQERQGVRSAVVEKVPGNSGFAVQERPESRTPATSPLSGKTETGAMPERKNRAVVMPEMPGNAGFCVPEWREVRPVTPVKTPDFSGFAVPKKQEDRVATMPRTPGNAGFTVPERREVRTSTQPETPGHVGFAVPERQENRAAVMPEMPGNAGFCVPERREVRPAAPVKTPDLSGFAVPEKQEDRVAAMPGSPGNAGFTVPERREVRTSTQPRTPGYVGFAVPERQESPKSDRPLTAPQTMPPQTDPVLSNWIQIRHRDWSQEDRAQFSGFWQTYWQERQQQGHPYPEKPVRHRFLERVNLLSDGDRATMQDILRHHRISQ